MIKINYDFNQNVLDEYFDNIKDDVINRIKNLREAICLLQGKLSINDLSTNDNYKFVAKKIIINILKNSNFKDRDFEIANFSKLKAEFIDVDNDLDNLKPNNIISLIDFLLENDNLKLLILCPAINLSEKNQSLLECFDLENSLTIETLKLAFNYDYDNIGSKIRSFFRSKNIVKYCPYCNIVEVKYRSSYINSISTSHELDHFFDKASHPFLCYSLFNLVPSDSICNKTNKGIKTFSDEYHLNPYIDGFTSLIQYKPIHSKIPKKIEFIDLTITKSISIKKKKQLIGNSNLIEGSNDKGNINVFTLKTKYSDRIEEAEEIIDMVEKNAINLTSNASFLKMMNFVDESNNYINWYESNIRTKFNPNQYNDRAFSKFNRDLHDYFFHNDRSKKFNFIRKIIKNNR